MGVDLAGTTLLDAVAVGKHLLLRFDDGRTLHAHLGMDGSFTVGPRSRLAEWRRRLELRFDDGWLTGEDLADVGVVATADEPSLVGHLGPDLLDDDRPLDLGDAAARLGRLPDRPLAAALLDQRNVAGFGNVFAVELPFLAGLSPFQPVGLVDDLAALVGTGQALIRDSADRGLRNTTGRRLHVAEHWVYGRAGRPCPLCATTVEGRDERSSPWRRITAWCPTCQPLGDTRMTVDVVRIRRLLALHPARRHPAFPAGS